MRRRQQQRVENIRLLVSVDGMWSKPVRGVRSGHAARPTATSTCSSRIGVLLTAQFGYSRSFGRSCAALRSVVGVYSICPYTTALTRKKNALAELSREAQTLSTSGAAPARAKSGESRRNGQRVRRDGRGGGPNVAGRSDGCLPASETCDRRLAPVIEPSARGPEQKKHCAAR